MADVAVDAAEYKETPRDDTQRAERLATMAARIFLGVERLARFPVAWWGINSLPTHGAFAISPQAELHGVIRVELHRRGYHLTTVPERAARALFLGKCPTKGISDLVCATVRQLDGCAGWRDDEIDAFIGANWLSCEIGHYAFAAALAGAQ